MNNIELNNFIRHQNFEIDKRLKKILKETKSPTLQDSMGYVLDGRGKKLRPLIGLICYKALGGETKEVYNAVISFELLHNFMLVHDDIMDNSEIRRGKTSLYKKYDVSQAILTGDILFALAYKNFIKDCSKENSSEIISLFTDFIIKIGEGQSLDSVFERKEDISIVEYKKMIYKKTAAMIEMSCCLVAKLYGASKEETNALMNYGKYFGMAFQIRDDVQDIFDNKNEENNKIGDDFIKGKKTYLFVKALSKAKGRDRDYLIKISKGNESLSEINKYKNICIKLGVLKDAEREIKRYLKLAKNSLNFIPDNEGKHLMLLFLNMINDDN